MSDNIVKQLAGSGSGQSLRDRVESAKHTLTGSTVAKTICKATTEEMSAPKEKHINYLILCTREPNVSIPDMGNDLINRLHNPNWVVVFKALITIHTLTERGSERFIQYICSTNSRLYLPNFSDKSGIYGKYREKYSRSSGGIKRREGIERAFDMSNVIRKYSGYIEAKAKAYLHRGKNFCKMSRGENGELRTLPHDKKLKSLQVLNSQLSALLEINLTTTEMSNPILYCAFKLCHNDAVKLFVLYNDAIIGLITNFFSVGKKKAFEVYDAYVEFFQISEKMERFFKIAENVGLGSSINSIQPIKSLSQSMLSYLNSFSENKGIAHEPVKSGATSRSTGNLAKPTSSPSSAIDVSGRSGGAAVVEDLVKFGSSQDDDGKANILSSSGSANGGGGGGGANNNVNLDNLDFQKILEEEQMKLQEFSDLNTKNHHQGGGQQSGNLIGSDSNSALPFNLFDSDLEPPNQSNTQTQPTASVNLFEEQQKAPQNPFGAANFDLLTASAPITNQQHQQVIDPFASTNQTFNVSSYPHQPMQQQNLFHNFAASSSHSSSSYSSSAAATTTTRNNGAADPFSNLSSNSVNSAVNMSNNKNNFANFDAQFGATQSEPNTTAAASASIGGQQTQPQQQPMNSLDSKLAAIGQNLMGRPTNTPSKLQNSQSAQSTNQTGMINWNGAIGGGGGVTGAANASAGISTSWGGANQEVSKLPMNQMQGGGANAAFATNTAPPNPFASNFSASSSAASSHIASQMPRQTFPQQQRNANSNGDPFNPFGNF